MNVHITYCILLVSLTSGLSLHTFPHPQLLHIKLHKNKMQLSANWWKEMGLRLSLANWLSLSSWDPVPWIQAVCISFYSAWGKRQGLRQVKCRNNFAFMLRKSWHKCSHNQGQCEGIWLWCTFHSRFKISLLTYVASRMECLLPIRSCSILINKFYTTLNK